MLPADLPDWNNVYAMFRRWVRDNVMERMYDRLRDMMRARVDREVSPTAAVLDSQSTKTSPQGGPKGFDGGKKVSGRKRHLVVDTLGLLLTVLVTTANVQDRNVAAQILASTKAKHPTVVKTYVDAGYCGAKTHTAVAQHGIALEVVKRPNHGNRQWLGDDELPLFPEVIEPDKPFTILPKRWVVARSNAWTERARRMNRDQDRLLKVQGYRKVSRVHADAVGYFGY
jgi:transposase